MTANISIEEFDNSLTIDDLHFQENQRCNSLEYSSDDLGSLPISPVSDNESSCSLRAENLDDHFPERAGIKESLNDESPSHSTRKDGAGDEVKENEHCVPVVSSNENDDLEELVVETAITSNPWMQFSDCNRRNNDGQSPLSLSSANCFLRGMTLLIEKGAEVNLVDNYGRSPLHLACENKDASEHHSCVEFLLKNGADTSVKDSFGRTPLHIAAKEGCKECIELLLNYGARMDEKDASGDTPLHAAASMSHFECMCALSPACCDESDSHSSVEPVSPSIFDKDNVNSSFSFSDNSAKEKYRSQDAVDSFYSFRNDLPLREKRRGHHCNIVRIEDGPWNDRNQCHSSRSHNDSGYFTAKSNGAWTKSKYYDNDPIREEGESLDSGSETESSSKSNVDLPSYEFDRLIGNNTSTILSQIVGFVIGLVSYLFRVLFQKKNIIQKYDANEKVNFKFTQPPDHVADAMERWKQSKQFKQLQCHREIQSNETS